MGHSSIVGENPYPYVDITISFFFVAKRLNVPIKSDDVAKQDSFVEEKEQLNEKVNRVEPPSRVTPEPVTYVARVSISVPQNKIYETER